MSETQKQLSLFKRVIANIIDVFSMYIFGIGLIFNTYFYYKSWTTLWLKIFNWSIIDINSQKEPEKKKLAQRFFYKYGGFILLYVLCYYAGWIINMWLLEILSTFGNSNNILGSRVVE